MIEPYRVVTTAQMRQLERAAQDAGVTEAQLQERAAAQIALVAAEEAGPPDRRLIVALVGPGNNGRDAMLAVRNLARQGYLARLYLSPRHAVRDEDFRELRGLGIVWQEHDSAKLDVLAEWLGDASAAIDGLLGIGLQGPMREPLSTIARALNDARSACAGRLRVLSADVPSGLDSDTGETPGVVVQADVTVALGAVKAGTLRFPGASLAGRLEPRPIGLPPELKAALPIQVMDAPHARALVPGRPIHGHKGTFGSVLVVGGSRDYVGAPILAAMGAARSGCGLVGLAGPARLQTAAAARLPEATYALLPGEGAETEPGGSLEALSRVAERFDVLLLGPGLGRSDGASEVVRGLLSGVWPSTRPVVVDADALNHLAQWPRWWEGTRPPMVLTPHLGEMGRLTNRPVSTIDHASWETAREFAVCWGQTLVLKSAHTVVAAPDGSAWVSPWANPALATAGSGDVLAGIIGALLAQGLDTASAARLGVALQAATATILLADRGWRTLLASDVAEEIPRALELLSKAEATHPIRWDLYLP